MHRRETQRVSKRHKFKTLMNNEAWILKIYYFHNLNKWTKNIMWMFARVCVCVIFFSYFFFLRTNMNPMNFINIATLTRHKFSCLLHIYGNWYEMVHSNGIYKSYWHTNTHTSELANGQMEGEETGKQTQSNCDRTNHSQSIGVKWQKESIKWKKK